jgi:hypothetical protein
MIKDDSHVGGQANAARVGYPLAIKDQKVRPDGQSLKGIQNAWTLPKRQQAGDVREGGWSLTCCTVHRLQVYEAENDDGRPCHAFTETDIYSCHRPHFG